VDAIPLANPSQTRTVTWHVPVTVALGVSVRFRDEPLPLKG
jgi:hypothetical protein